jgi:hypothetical protein
MKKYIKRWVILKRVTDKIRSGRSPLIRDGENGLIIGSTEGTWKVFEKFGIFGAGQRRGAHVSVPKIGSRAALLCFGGILGFYAVLRREYFGGNLNLEFFGGLPGVRRVLIEEGGQFVFPPSVWGNFNINLVGFCRVLTPCKVSCGL